MDRNEYKTLSSFYPIKAVVEVKEIGKGISSDAKLVVTSIEKYILRRIKDPKQAITEYKVSKVLSRHNISPEILLSVSHQPFIEFDGGIYNLQTFISIHNREHKINFYDLGRTIGIFHSELQRIDGLYEQADRFSLHEMWERLKQNNGFPNLVFKGELQKMVERCFTLNHENNCYIHGDLGKWNLLFGEDNIYIIDFGEVRRGNNHFDMSAVISSTLDWSQENVVIFASLHDFMKGYKSNFAQFDWTLLSESLALWFTRGIVALLNHNGIDARNCDSVKLMIDRKNRLEGIIKAIIETP